MLILILQGISEIEKHLNDQIIIKKQENAFIKDLKVFKNEESMANNIPLVKETRFNPQVDKFFVSFTKTKYINGYTIARALDRNQEEDELDAQEVCDYRVNVNHRLYSHLIIHSKIR